MATGTALLAQVFGPSLQGAFQQPSFGGSSALNLDILQIVTYGDNPFVVNPTVLVNVDFTGAVHNPAVAPTNGTKLGVFSTPLATGTTAQFFASAFVNPANLDILQNINQGGNVTYSLNFQGVASGS